MSTRKYLFFLIFSITVLAASFVLADDVSSVQCGTYTVYQGDSQGDLLMKCGEPTYTEGDQWIYVMGDSETRTVFHLGGEQEGNRKVMRMEIKEK